MTRRLAAPALLGLAAIGSLAGCAAPAAPSPAPTESVESAPAAPASPAPATTQDAAAPGTVYADGAHSATGQYLAPSGPERIDVTITIESDLVSAVAVTGHARDETAQEYQAEFISGIGALVIGKPLAELSVSRVAGSSLTSTGFNAALDTIRGDALR